MPVPNLIHPVLCTIQPLDRVTTLMDMEFREPLPSERRLANVVIQAQVRWFGMSERHRENVGGSQVSKGYLLFRLKDLTDSGYSPKVGDLVLHMGSQTNINMYLESFEDRGHYPDQQGPTMRRAYFTDREPTREARDYV